QAAAEEARETARKTAERKKRKSEAKKKRLQKSKMSFALEEDEEEEEAESSGSRVGPQRTDPASLVAGKQPAASLGCTAVEKEGGDDRPSKLPSGHGITKNRDGCGGGMSESRSLKGAAPDEENSSAAAKLRERLGRDQP
ncbi:unnamed protein product, partial [Ectocarpus sp. 8 AP-2014]